MWAAAVGVVTGKRLLGRGWWQIVIAGRLAVILVVFVAINAEKATASNKTSIPEGATKYVAVQAKYALDSVRVEWGRRGAKGVPNVPSLRDGTSCNRWSRHCVETIEWLLTRGIGHVRFAVSAGQNFRVVIDL